ncbi:uncharacterized protein LOC119311287 isoform X2 [Triticum dicoccoides]|uniref:uncharacterized protein LOC119311287 isoform X2 n=1 Tax=Triticum dicoccoides TaxID=85692 RepID=UPI0018911A6A|nr:uncharacterized protein LOC119311287 isoform X2 [Triticum dicoccoides]
MGRQDAEAEAELQDIEAAYAAESARRRHLPDWSKTPAPRSRPPTAQPSPHGRVCLLAVVGALSPTCQDSYRRKDTFSFLLDGQQHNHNNRSISSAPVGRRSGATPAPTEYCLCYNLPR